MCFLSAHFDTNHILIRFLLSFWEHIITPMQNRAGSPVTYIITLVKSKYRHIISIAVAYSTIVSNLFLLTITIFSLIAFCFLHTFEPFVKGAFLSRFRQTRRFLEYYKWVVVICACGLWQCVRRSGAGISWPLGCLGWRVRIFRCLLIEYDAIWIIATERSEKKRNFEC